MAAVPHPRTLADIRAMALSVRLFGLTRLPGMIDRGELKLGGDHRAKPGEGK